MCNCIWRKINLRKISILVEYFIDNFRDILIPTLQRDYVQGEHNGIIKPFIDELLVALKGDKKIDLNYIYGSDEDKAFVPIDGQQRLITLWLLHLYLYVLQGKGKSFNVALRFYSRELS